MPCCVCSVSLGNLLNALIPFEGFPVVAFPPTMASLGIALGGLGGVPVGAEAIASLRLALAIPLPPLAISASAIAQLSAMANIVATLRGFGINLMAPNISAQLALTIGSLNANFPGLNLGKFHFPNLIPLGLLAALLQNLALALNIPLGTPGAMGLVMPRLTARMALTAGLSLPGLALMANYAAVLNAAAALGINLLAPGGVASLMAAINLLASIQIPPLTFNLLALLNLLGLLAAIAGLNKLNLDFRLPGFALKINAMIGLVLALPSINLSLPNLALPLAAASMNLAAAASLNLSAMANISIPSLGGLGLVASLLAQANLALGIPLCSPLACGGCGSAKLF